MITGADRLRRRARPLVAALMCAIAMIVSCAGYAADSALAVEELMQRLSQVKSARATFVERKHLRVLSAPLELTGTLVYNAPGYLEKQTLTPKPESLILDNDTLTFEDRSTKRRRTLRLQQYPVVWAFVESIRSTLAGDVQSLNRFYKVSLQGTEAEWRLTLDPREPDIRRMVKEIRIAGARASIRTIEVTETEGDRSVMTITESK